MLAYALVPEDFSSVSSFGVRTFIFASRTFIICAHPQQTLSDPPRHHLPQPIPLHVRPRRLRIVGKHHQPPPRHRLRVALLLALDSLKRKEIEGYSPNQINVRGGWNQVGDVTRRLAAAGYDHRLHMRSVSGEDFH